MWISRKEYDELKGRVSALEDANWCIRAPHGAKLGRVVAMVMAHLGIRIDRQTERDQVVKDG